MNKKKAYTGMKTPELMKVGNSAVFAGFPQNPAEIRPAALFRGWLKSAYGLLLLWFLVSCFRNLSLRIGMPDKFDNFSKRRSLHSGSIPSF